MRNIDRTEKDGINIGISTFTLKHPPSPTVALSMQPYPLFNPQPASQKVAQNQILTPNPCQARHIFPEIWGPPGAETKMGITFPLPPQKPSNISLSRSYFFHSQLSLQCGCKWWPFSGRKKMEKWHLEWYLQFAHSQLSHGAESGSWESDYEMDIARWQVCTELKRQV